MISCHLFPGGYQQRGPYHFNEIQTIDYDFLWSPPWRLFSDSSPFRKVLRSSISQSSGFQFCSVSSHFVSQSTDFPFRFVSFRPILFRKIQISHFVSFHFVSPDFVSQSIVSPSWVHLKHENEKSATKKKMTAQMTLEWCTANVHGSLDGILKRLCESSLAVVRSSTVWKTKLGQWIQNQQHSL